MYRLDRAEGKLVMKKVVRSKSLVELSIQILLGLVSRTMSLVVVPHTPFSSVVHSVPFFQRNALLPFNFRRNRRDD